jgi:hypothetical protein
VTPRARSGTARDHASRAPWRRVLAAAIVGNLLTHLSIHFVLPRAHLPAVAFEVVAEGLAFAAEAALYALAVRPQSAWWGVTASAVANGASYLVGLALFG